MLAMSYTAAEKAFLVTLTFQLLTAATASRSIQDTRLAVLEMLTVMALMT